MDKKRVRIYKAPDGKGKFINKTAKFLQKAQMGAEVQMSQEDMLSQYFGYAYDRLKRNIKPEAVYADFIKSGIPQETAYAVLTETIKQMVNRGELDPEYAEEEQTQTEQPQATGEEQQIASDEEAQRAAYDQEQQELAESDEGYYDDEEAYATDDSYLEDEDSFQYGGYSDNPMEQYATQNQELEQPMDMEEIIANTPGIQEGLVFPGIEQYLPDYSPMDWQNFDALETSSATEEMKKGGAAKKNFVKNVMELVKKQMGGPENGESKAHGKGKRMDNLTSDVENRKNNFVNTLRDGATKAASEKMYDLMMKSGDPKLMQIAMTPDSSQQQQMPEQMMQMGGIPTPRQYRKAYRQMKRMTPKGIDISRANIGTGYYNKNMMPGFGRPYTQQDMMGLFGATAGSMGLPTASTVAPSIYVEDTDWRGRPKKYLIDYSGQIVSSMMPKGDVVRETAKTINSQADPSEPSNTKDSEILKNNPKETNTAEQLKVYQTGDNPFDVMPGTSVPEPLIQYDPTAQVTNSVEEIQSESPIYTGATGSSEEFCYPNGACFKFPKQQEEDMVLFENLPRILATYSDKNNLGWNQGDYLNPNIDVSKLSKEDIVNAIQSSPKLTNEKVINNPGLEDFAEKWLQYQGDRQRVFGDMSMQNMAFNPNTDIGDWDKYSDWLNVVGTPGEGDPNDIWSTYGVLQPTEQTVSPLEQAVMQSQITSPEVYSGATSSSEEFCLPNGICYPKSRELSTPYGFDFRAFNEMPDALTKAFGQNIDFNNLTKDDIINAIMNSDTFFDIKQAKKQNISEEDYFTNLDSFAQKFLDYQKNRQNAFGESYNWKQPNVPVTDKYSDFLLVTGQPGAGGEGVDPYSPDNYYGNLNPSPELIKAYEEFYGIPYDYKKQSGGVVNADSLPAGALAKFIYGGGDADMIAYNEQELPMAQYGGGPGWQYYTDWLYNQPTKIYNTGEDPYELTSNPLPEELVTLDETTTDDRSTDGPLVRRAQINYVPRYRTTSGGLFRTLAPWNPIASYAGSWAKQMTLPYMAGTATPYAGSMEGLNPVARRVTKTGLLGRPKKWTDYYATPGMSGTQLYRSSTGELEGFSPNTLNMMEEMGDKKGQRTTAAPGEKYGVDKETWDAISAKSKGAIKRGYRRNERSDRRAERAEEQEKFFPGGSILNASTDDNPFNTKSACPPGYFKDPASGLCKNFAGEVSPSTQASTAAATFQSSAQAQMNTNPFQATGTNTVTGQDYAYTKDGQLTKNNLDPVSDLSKPSELVGVDYKRKDMRNIDPEAGLNVFNASVRGGLNILDKWQNRGKENTMIRENTGVEGIYSEQTPQFKGDWVDYGSQLGQYRFDQMGQDRSSYSSYGQKGGFMQSGGYTEDAEVYMTDEEIADFMANGGEIEYL